MHIVKEESTGGVFTTTAVRYISLVKEPAQIDLPSEKSPLSELDETQKNAILKLLEKYPTLRVEKGLGTTTLTKHRIETGSAALVTAYSWRRPEVEHQEVEKDVKVMREAGLIEKSASP